MTERLQFGTYKGKVLRGRAAISFRGSFPAAAFLTLLVPWTRLFSCAPGNNPAPPSVILISVDTLRADHLSCYNSRAHQTPHFDALARSGTLFSQISSQIPLTLPSHTSLLTSTYPFWNGVNENGEVVRPGMVTLPGILRSHGYKTAAFIGGYFLARQFGLNQGFDLYDSPFSSMPGSLTKALDLKRPAGKVIASAEKWLAQNSSQPTFAFVHLFDLHMPYDPPARWHEALKGDDYDAELAYVDDGLGKFVTFLKAHDLYNRTLIVLTSDHGESLGEHGESTHGYFIYESTLRVPLIVHWPVDGTTRPATEHAPAGLIDVAPTILQALNIDVSHSFQGHSLLGRLRADLPRAKEPVYSESLYAHDNFGCAPLRSLRLGMYQYISAPHAELYNLRDDPREVKNLAKLRSDLAASMQDKLGAFLAAHGAKPPESPKPINEDDAEILRTMGYLQLIDPRAVTEPNGADPKECLREYREYLRALRLSQTGHLAEAEAAFEWILYKDPECANAHYELARCFYRQRNYYDTVKHLQDAVDLNPQNLAAKELLGSVWMEVQDYKRARAEFEHLLTMLPDNYVAHYWLGVIANFDRNPAEAAREFQAAVAARPDSWEAHLELGRSYLQQEKLAEAQREFHEVIALSPGSGAGYYELGKVFQAQGQLAEATRMYRKALRISPKFDMAQTALKSLPGNFR
jgi:choline-sulfatase